MKEQINKGNKWKEIWPNGMKESEENRKDKKNERTKGKRKRVKNRP